MKQQIEAPVSIRSQQREYHTEKETFCVQEKKTST